MKKFLVLMACFFCVIGLVVLHRAYAQECPGMNAYMITTSKQCINLSSLQRRNSSHEHPNGQTTSKQSLILKAEQNPIFPPQQNANTIVVDNNRNFLNAIRQLKAGDRLLVKNGTYQAPKGDGIVVTAQGTTNNWVVIAAYPGHKPKLKGTDWKTIHLDRAAYIEIRGFEVEGADPGQNPSGSGIAATNRSHHIRVIKNLVHDVPGTAIGAILADYLHVEGNAIYNVAWGWIPSNPDRSYAESAISFYQLTNSDHSQPGIHNVVRGNAVFNAHNTKPFVNGDDIAYGGGLTDGNCFILDDTRHTQKWGAAVKAGFTSSYTGTTIVENNLCVDNGGRGIHAFLSDNLIARNNTLYKNGKTPGIDGELSTNRSRNIHFYNNILYAHSNSKAIVNINSSNVGIENNLLFGSDNKDKGVGTLIKGNPLFVNPNTDLNTANFSLRSGSPAIGTGFSKNCAVTYFDGASRHGSCDLGAFPASS
jgi:parallel beta-helix repeat protein